MICDLCKLRIFGGKTFIFRDFAPPFQFFMVLFVTSPANYRNVAVVVWAK